MDIFVSHSHEDRAIVDALDDLHRAFFGDEIKLVRSSDQSVGGGIPPGARWLDWITDKITSSSKAYVLLTPNSIRKPWVLWESGAAAGVALATERRKPVVPIAFGISDNDVPTPFQPTEMVRGDTDQEGGIHRLLGDLGGPGAGELATAQTASLTTYLQAIVAALEGAPPTGTLLATVPHSLSATRLAGHWVTSYEFRSSGEARYHADVAEVTAESDRRLTANNRLPDPVTDGRTKPFCNEIDAEIVNRHVIGDWKNTSDTRYFGTLHMAVLSDDNVMEGYYTSLSSDVAVGTGRWRWVRIAAASLQGRDLTASQLRTPAEIHALVEAHDHHAGAVDVAAVLQEA